MEHLLRAISTLFHSPEHHHPNDFQKALHLSHPFRWFCCRNEGLPCMPPCCIITSPKIQSVTRSTNCELIDDLRCYREEADASTAWRLCYIRQTENADNDVNATTQTFWSLCRIMLHVCRTTSRWTYYGVARTQHDA